MYESAYTTDWSHLTRDEAVERAYALGVAAACGHDNRNEYEAIKAVAENSYDRSLIELSFDQGKSRALKLEASGSDTEEIWDELVEKTTITPQNTDSGLPKAIESTEIFKRFSQIEGPPSSLSKPSFLLRNKQDNE